MTDYVNRATAEVHDLGDLIGLAGALLAEQASTTRTATRLDRALQDVEDLRHQVADLGADLTTREDPNTNAKGGSIPASGLAWNWRTLHGHGAEILWRDVNDWVGWLRHRYPVAQQVPPCWWRHTELIEELTALYLAWRAAYTDANANLTAPADFHHHYLPAAIERVTGWGVHCSDQHRDRASTVYAATPDPGDVPPEPGADVPPSMRADRVHGAA